MKEMKEILEQEEARLEREFPGRHERPPRPDGKTTSISSARFRS